jgi:hypothetical protein
LFAVEEQFVLLESEQARAPAARSGEESIIFFVTEIVRGSVNLMESQELSRGVILNPLRYEISGFAGFFDKSQTTHTVPLPTPSPSNIPTVSPEREAL